MIEHSELHKTLIEYDNKVLNYKEKLPFLNEIKKFNKEIPFQYPKCNKKYIVRDIDMNKIQYSLLKDKKIWQLVYFLNTSQKIYICIINGKSYLKPYEVIRKYEFEMIFDFKPMGKNKYDPNKVVFIEFKN